jgi:hypothetical protein
LLFSWTKPKTNVTHPKHGLVNLTVLAPNFRFRTVGGVAVSFSRFSGPLCTHVQCVLSQAKFDRCGLSKSLSHSTTIKHQM